MKSMFKVDTRRMFHSTLVYLMWGICLVIPILILVMTTMLGDADTASFDNAWQIIGSLGSSGDADAGMSMDMTAMCNINLVFFLLMIFVCLFVGADFRSGYAKNLFTVRAKRLDYVISKTLVSFIAGVGMLLCFLVGGILGGAIAGLPFSMDGFNALNLVCSMLAKIFLTLVFIAIAVTMSCVGKQRLWLSILGVLAVGMLLFMMIPMITPLNANLLHVVLCLAGGLIFATGLGAVSKLLLNKMDLV